MRSKLIAGNWKMHGTIKETRKLILQLAVEWKKSCEQVEVLVCPPFTSLIVARHELEMSHIKLGAQNCFTGIDGAYTGEISATMLAEIGCSYVIVGHSERRTIFAETDDLVSRKVRSVLDAKLNAIVCIGESEAQRTSGETEAVLSRQLKGSLAGLSASDIVSVTIAYEPVWAIGTGKTASPEVAETAHRFVRSELETLFPGTSENVRILYGGSIKAENAVSLFSQPNIDGGLVGGASLDAEGFIDIIQAAVSL